MRVAWLGMLLCAGPCLAATLFVDASAPPGGDGLLWSTAFVDLQDALDAARADPLFTDIHVAAGAYRPDRGTLDETASFTLIDGVALLGGFPTGGGTAEERDPATHPTILHGDLLGDDLPPDEFGFLHGIEDNADHVVSAESCGPATLLDGLTIRGGNADDDFPGTQSGGNILIAGGGPTVRHCVIARGRASWAGGGLAAIDATPLVEGCVFRENVADRWGGGAAIMGMTSGILRGCRFERNTGGSGAGAFCGPLRFDGVGNATVIQDCEFIAGRSPIGSTAGAGVLVVGGDNLIIACRFIGNVANGGGGASVHRGGARFERCVFYGNRGDGDGGGALSVAEFEAAQPAFTTDMVSCLMAGNNGAIVAIGSRVNLTNCTIVRNNLPDRPESLVWPAIFSQNAPVNLTNSIVWGNVDADLFGGVRDFLAGSLLYTVQDSIVEDWDGTLAGDALDVDPGFVDSNGLDDNPLTPGDNNYRLRLDSPAVDTGDNGAVAAASLDLEGRPRILDGDGDSDAIVDMGALERCYVDLDGDGTTGLADATALVEALVGPFASSSAGDLDGDGDTDLGDYAVLQRFLVAGCD